MSEQDREDKSSLVVTGKICFLTLTVQTPSMCWEKQCPCFIENSGNCRLIYLIERLNYNIPMIGNMCGAITRTEVGRFKAAQKYGIDRKKAAQEQDEEPL